MRRSTIGAAILVLLIHLTINVAAINITSPFGWRTHPITGEPDTFHSGTDIAAETGTPIVTLWDGQVVFSDYWGGYGNCVIVDHGNNTYTLYGHCSEIIVQAGENINQGQIIAYVGSTGNSTGPHLHLEIWQNGQYVDPLTVLVQ